MYACTHRNLVENGKEIKCEWKIQRNIFTHHPCYTDMHPMAIKECHVIVTTSNSALIIRVNHFMHFNLTSISMCPHLPNVTMALLILGPARLRTY